MRRALTLVLLLAVAGCSSGDPKPGAEPSIVGSTAAPASEAPSPTPSPTQQTRRLPIGTTLTIDTTAPSVATYAITVKSAKWTKAPCKFGSPPTQTWLIVDVTVKVVAGPAPVNPVDFQFVDTTGATTDALMGLKAGCPSFGGTGVHTGTTEAGNVAYDVPRGAGLLEWRPDWTPVASWEIPG